MKDWVVVLQPNGVVEAVENGAPSTWVGHALASIADAPQEVRHAAREIAARPASAKFLQRWLVHTSDGSIEIVLVEGLPLRKTYTHVADLMVRLLDVFASQAQSSAIRFSVRQEGDIVLSIDREKIAWALTTLVGNALRYVRGAPSAHVDVQFSVDEQRDEVVVVVADNGPGMPPQRAKWLFSRDPTTGASAGLALVMVHDVIVAHRGRIEVETSPGSGTAFTVRLPRGAS